MLHAALRPAVRITHKLLPMQVLRETELKLQHLQQQRSQALKRKRDQADVPSKQKQESTAKPRREKLVTKAELETNAAAGEPVKRAGSDEMEDMPIAQRMHKAPGSQRQALIITGYFIWIQIQ